MNNKLFNYLFRLKFLGLTFFTFVSIALLTKLDFSFFYSDSTASFIEAILYSFNSSYETGISLDTLKVISIYLVIIYLVFDFITENLGNAKFSVILRIGNLNMYILKLIISTCFISFIYFSLGMIIISLVNMKSIIYVDFQQLNTVLKIVISSNLIMFFIINIIFIVIIKTKKVVNSIVAAISILSLGFMNISSALLPINYIYTYKIIDSVKYLNIYYIIHIVIIISLTLCVLFISKNNKDFLLFDYEI